jgi:hypothetical protein
MAKFKYPQNRNLLFNFINFNLFLKIEFIKKQLFISIRNVFSEIEKIETKNLINNYFRVQQLG